MKKFWKTSFAASLIFLFFVASPVEANAQLTRVINLMEENRKSLVTLKSKITMVKHDALLKISDVTKGDLTYLKKNDNNYLRIDWKTPVEEHIIVIEDSHYEVYRPGINQLAKGSLKKAKGTKKLTNALGFMSMSKAELKKNYKVELIGKESVSGGGDVWTPTFRLRLTPKKRDSFSYADLWVRKEDGMPLQAKIYEKNKDYTGILLYTLQINVDMNTKVFSPKYPKNVKIV